MNSTQAVNKPQVPLAVRHHVEWTLGVLHEQDRALTGVQRARGDGFYLALELRDRQDKIREGKAELQTFRDLAARNGVDADAFIAELGGEPDFARFGEPAAAHATATGGMQPREPVPSEVRH